MNSISLGQIITFYSYKGGTGRTMALANTACVLAERQFRTGGPGVLIIDWDLEAPGLHRYFRQERGRGHEDSRDSRPGLIDLFYELDSKTDQLLQKGGESAGADKLMGEELAREAIGGVKLDDFILSTGVPGLSLIKAGRFGRKRSTGYSERVNTFNWEALYKKSPHLIRMFGETLARRFAYVLIDSRTGVTDISGICTMLLPEKLVVVFTPNLQSLTGVIDLVRKATEYRKESSDLRPLLVFPLVSRVEANEPDLRHDWRFGSVERGINGYQPEIEQLFSDVYQLRDVDLTGYFDEIQIQHIPRYAYGEEIAILVERSGDKFSIRRSYQSFASKLVESRVPWQDGSRERMSAQKEAGASLEWLRAWVARTRESYWFRRSMEFAFGRLLVVAAVGSFAVALVQGRAAAEARTAALRERAVNDSLTHQLARLDKPEEVIRRQDSTITQLYATIQQASASRDSVLRLAQALRDSSAMLRRQVYSAREQQAAAAEEISSLHAQLDTARTRCREIVRRAARSPNEGVLLARRC